MGFRLQRTVDIVRSIQSNQSYYMRTLFKCCATHEEILKQRKRLVYDHEYWKKLPRWAHERLNTIWDLYLQEIQNQLLFTYVWQGKRLCVNFEPNFPHGDVGRADKSQTLPDHCYPVLVEGKFMWLPFGEENRQADIDAGRLPADFLKIQAKYPCPIERLRVDHKPNGSPYLAWLVKYEFTPQL